MRKQLRIEQLVLHIPLGGNLERVVTLKKRLNVASERTLISCSRQRTTLKLEDRMIAPSYSDEAEQDLTSLRKRRQQTSSPTVAFKKTVKYE